MSMMEAVKSVFSKYAVFSGRARRSEYWYFQLFVFLVNAVFGVFLTHMEPETRQYALVSILEGVFGLVVFVPTLAVSWRRFHDIGKSGAWSLMGLFAWLAFFVFVIVLALVYSATGSSASDVVMGTIGLFAIAFFLAVMAASVLMLIWTCRQGQTGPNRFGPDPKRPEMNAETQKAPWEY